MGQCVAWLTFSDDDGDGGNGAGSPSIRHHAIAPQHCFFEPSGGDLQNYAPQAAVAKVLGRAVIGYLGHYFFVDGLAVGAIYIKIFIDFDRSSLIPMDFR